MQGQPLVHGEGLRTSVRGDGAARQGCRQAVALQAGKLSQQHVVEHLAALAEGRLHEPPELVLGGWRPGAAGARYPTRMAESTAGAGSKAAAGTMKAMRTSAWYWTKTDR